MTSKIPSEGSGILNGATSVTATGQSALNSQSDALNSQLLIFWQSLLTTHKYLRNICCVPRATWGTVAPW